VGAVTIIVGAVTIIVGAVTIDSGGSNYQLILVKNDNNALYS
jgi:hypothetical protein